MLVLRLKQDGDGQISSLSATIWNIITQQIISSTVPFSMVHLTDWTVEKHLDNNLFSVSTSYKINIMCRLIMGETCLAAVYNSGEAHTCALKQCDNCAHAHFGNGPRHEAVFLSSSER